MNFFKIISFLILSLLLSAQSYADSHDSEQNIIERAKEINQKVKEKTEYLPNIYIQNCMEKIKKISMLSIKAFMSRGNG